MSSMIIAAPAGAGEPVVRVDLELVAAVDLVSSVCRGPSRRRGSGSGRSPGGTARAWRDQLVALEALDSRLPNGGAHAGGQVDDLEAVERQARVSLLRTKVSSRVVSASLVVDGHADGVGRHRVGDVRALRVDVDRVRLADVAGVADLDGVLRVRDVHDLQAALGRPGDASSPWSWQRPSASVASMISCASASASSGSCEELLRIPGLFGVTSTSCWSPSAAGGVAHAARRRVRGEEAGVDLLHALVVGLGQLDDALPAGVGAHGEGADHGELLARPR
jgi:hypothetical protein